MAAQNADPPAWNPAMSDGCSVPFFLKWTMRRFLKYCLKHDKKYHFGGDWRAKLSADDELWRDIHDDGWLGRRFAGPAYWHIRAYTYNFPPGDPNRSWRNLTKGKAWNWLGKGMPT